MIPPLPWKSVSFPVLGLLGIFLVSSVSALMLDVDLGGEIDLSDDSGVYVTVLSRHFRQDPQHINQLYDLCPDSDDLAVILFVAEATGKSPAFIMALRGQSVSWWEISEGMNMNPNDWFTQVRTSPRPPYAEAYRKWVAAGETGSKLVLTDADCRNLVAAKFLHQVFEVTIARAMEMRATGKDLQRLSADEVRRRQENTNKNGKVVAGNSANS